jgi:hypothetical protein
MVCRKLLISSHRWHWLSHTTVLTEAPCYLVPCVTVTCFHQSSIDGSHFVRKPQELFLLFSQLAGDKDSTHRNATFSGTFKVGDCSKKQRTFFCPLLILDFLQSRSPNAHGGSRRKFHHLKETEPNPQSTAAPRLGFPFNCHHMSQKSCHRGPLPWDHSQEALEGLQLCSASTVLGFNSVCHQMPWTGSQNPSHIRKVKIEVLSPLVVPNVVTWMQLVAATDLISASYSAVNHQHRAPQ